MAILEFETTVRPKNQLTLPRQIVELHGIEAGHRLIIVDSGVQDEFTVRVIRPSYAGALAGVFFGTTEENVAYVRGERENWD